MKLCHNLLCGLRQEAVQQGCPHRNRLCQIIKYLCQTVGFRLVLRKYPRCRLIDIFVAAAEHAEYLRNGICHTQILHLLCHSVSGSGHNCL